VKPKNVVLICQKELKSYFASPIAYGVMAFFASIFGWVFYNASRDFVRFSLQSQMMGQSGPMNVNEQIIRPLLGFASTITLFLIPMLTMRLFAEEKRTGTIELLLTSPVKDMEIILGKWLGALLLYICVLGMSMLNIALLFLWGKPDLKPVLVSYLGLILQGGCLLAIGALISTMTKNQIIAGIATFFLSLLLWLLSWFTAYDSTIAAQLLGYLSIVTHFENFGKGVLDSKDVVFYLSMIFFALFLTSRSLESGRWRA
jgi:ABC-2 type transport system permease protein